MATPGNRSAARRTGRPDARPPWSSPRCRVIGGTRSVVTDQKAADAATCVLRDRCRARFPGRHAVRSRRDRKATHVRQLHHAIVLAAAADADEVGYAYGE